MTEPTWDEYFAQAWAYLSGARRALESGGPPPPPPARPVTPLPRERRDEARRLGTGLDQLALEVEARLGALGRRLSSSPRSPHRARVGARYVERPL